ncbi:class I SAM-dependent methyltransferase [uncultured Chryseobacterium sp.]|uniref:class I SAM-dependent methyltransferase n=1 Tax=uncultured Chryseobacterium sp. TaxID=259322 RepID=UPI0025EA2F74|nr:class I SAM-dependent methyltransferase [uncultured Chryseobacterium sp.]
MDFKKITIQSYDQTATEYSSNVNSFTILPELDIFTNLIFENGKILDLGCGPGHHSKYFADLGFDVTGIDLSEKMIGIARKNFKNIDFQIMDIENLIFTKNSFDGIWASASLLHIEKKNLPIVLLKLKEILKNNGILYISLKLGFGEQLIQDNRYSDVFKFYSYFQNLEIEKFVNNCNLNIFESRLVDQRNEYDTNSWIHIFIKKTNDN